MGTEHVAVNRADTPTAVSIVTRIDTLYASSMIFSARGAQAALRLRLGRPTPATTLSAIVLRCSRHTGPYMCTQRNTRAQKHNHNHEHARTCKWTHAPTPPRTRSCAQNGQSACAQTRVDARHDAPDDTDARNTQARDGLQRRVAAPGPRSCDQP